MKNEYYVTPQFMLSERYVNEEYSTSEIVVFDDRRIIEDNYELLFDIMYLMRYDFGLDKIGLASDLLYRIYATIEKNTLYMGICDMSSGKPVVLTKKQVFSPSLNVDPPLYINGDRIFEFVFNQLKRFDNSHR